jgi:hypothetical protein
MTYTNEDSLKVTENGDGTLGIEWDPQDPRYSFLNDMTQEDLQEYFTRALEEFIKQCEENEPVQ